MTWQPIPIVGGSAADDARLATPQETINWLPVKMERPGGRSDFILRSIPGMYHLTTVGTGPIRGDWNVEGVHYVVSGQRLYRMTSSDVAVELGIIPGTNRVSMTHTQQDGGYVLAVFNGPQGFTYTTATDTFAEITDEGFPGFRVAGFIDSYIAGIEKDGLFAAHSDLANAREYNTVDQYEAEAAPDLLVGQIIDHGEWWLMGGRTIEVYANTGATTGTFQRIPGSTIERGLAAPFAVAKLDNSVFLLGDDGIAYRASGYSLVRISTQQEEQQFAKCDLSQAFAFTYEDRGHKVFYLTFPDGFTHGYDVASGEWHKRKSYGLDNWRISTLTRVGERWIAGDRFNGKLYVLNWDFMQDDGGPLVSERITGILHKNGDKLVIDGLMLVFDTGRPQTEPGAAVVQPEPPTIAGDAPAGMVGSVYSYPYTLADGTPPYTVTLRSGALPDGLEIAADGELSGTPTVEGTFEWTLRVTDANGLYSDLEDGCFIIPLDSYISLIHGIGSNDDEMGNSWSGGVPALTPTLFGEGMIRCNGHLANCVTAAPFETTIGTGDFTIDVWIYRDSDAPGHQSDIILGHWYASGTRSLNWAISRSTNICSAFLSSDGTAFTQIDSTDTVALDGLVHLRLVREDGVVYQFVNGQLNGSAAFAGALHVNVGLGTNWIIGGNDSTNSIDPVQGLEGWWGEFAIFGISLGTDEFTPPIARWPNP